MTTASDVINSALRSIGELAEGETPSAETSADCLDLLNEMLDSWSNERLMVPYLQSEELALVGGTASYTIGSGGTFNTTRPIEIDNSSFTRIDGVDYPLRVINAPQYSSFPVKATQNSWPEYVYYEASYPLGRLYFYPVPSAAATLHLFSWKQLSTLATLATAFAVAPGVIRAIRSNLAIEIASNFGLKVPDSVLKTASDSKRNIKRVNAPNDVLSMPENMIRRRGAGYIYGDIT